MDTNYNSDLATHAEAIAVECISESLVAIIEDTVTDNINIRDVHVAI